MDAVVNVIGVLLPLAKAHPWLATATTVATILVLSQPLLRALVRWTPTNVDDLVLEVLLKVANLLTPAKVKRGEKVESAPPKPDPETHELPASDDTPTEN